MILRSHNPPRLREIVKIAAQVPLCVKKTNLTAHFGHPVPLDGPLSETGDLPVPGMTEKSGPSLAAWPRLPVNVLHHFGYGPDFRKPFEIFSSHPSQGQTLRIDRWYGARHVDLPLLASPELFAL
jgi:hypothetical protein